MNSTIPIRSCASCGRDASRVDAETLNCVHCGGNPFVAPKQSLDEAWRGVLANYAASRPANIEAAGAFVTLDSGAREEYSTGARRDTQAGKPRYDLIPVEALTRWAALMARGAEKYGDRNWEKGIPTDRFYASALRHLMQWRAGDNTEDHLSAVLFNIGGIIFNEERGNE